MRLLYTLGIAAALALCSIGNNRVDAAVMSIDYGAEWFKVGLVKPGIPFDIVLNSESKRKTPSVITIRGKDRSYSSEAVSLATRFPKDSFLGLKKILGRRYDDEHCVEYRNTFTNNMTHDPERGDAIGFETTSGEKYTVEELVAMQFALAKSQAEEAANGETIRDVVITVPPYFNQNERQALLDAADLAGLRVLSLVHDQSAVALNYAMTRSFPQEQCHVFYDMGAGSTVASVTCFKDIVVQDAGSKSNRTIQEIEVKATGYDRTLGGHEFDVRLQTYLAQKFQEQRGSQLSGPVAENPRALVKVLKEATRVKQILSANTETMASIENVMEDVDFKLKVTRKEFESLSQDLIARVRGPIDAALKEANIQPEAVQSIVLVGGGVRIPAVQLSLAAVIGEHKIAKNINGDEAAVMGAVFRGAALSRQFRVKEVRLKDRTMFPIQAKYTSVGPSSEDDDKDNAPTEGSSGSKVMTIPIFSPGSLLGTQKIMTFKDTTDFEFDLEYGIATNAELEKDFTSKEITHVDITGVADAVHRFKDVVAGTPKVKVAIALTQSGLVEVLDATAFIPTDPSKKAPSLKDKVKSFFGTSEKVDKRSETGEEVEGETADSKANPEKAAEPVESSTANDSGTNDTKESASAPVPTAAGEGKQNDAKKKETTPALKVEQVKLTVKVTPKGLMPLSTAAKVEAKERLDALNMYDKEKRAREEARNNLESFLYRTRELLYKDEIIEVTSDEQRETLSLKLSEISDWFDENEAADKAEFDQRLKELKDLEKPMSFRAAEKQARGEASHRVKEQLLQTRLAVDALLANETSLLTEKDVEDLKTKCDRIEEALREEEEAQNKLALWDEPVLTTRKLGSWSREVEDSWDRLVRVQETRLIQKQRADREAAAAAAQKAKEEEEAAKEKQKKEQESKDAVSDQTVFNEQTQQQEPKAEEAKSEEKKQQQPRKDEL